MKPKQLSPKKHSKFSLFSTVCIALGFVGVICAALFHFITELMMHSATIFAISLLFFFTGFILYFFHCQFSKLADISEDLEQEECSETE